MQPHVTQNARLHERLGKDIGWAQIVDFENSRAEMTCSIPEMPGFKEASASDYFFTMPHYWIGDSSRRLICQ